MSSRSMRRMRMWVVVALMTAGMLAACGRNEEPQAAGSSTVPEPPQVAARSASSSSAQEAAVATASAGIACSDVFGRSEGDKPGSTGGIPPGFPQPPSGSTLCGETSLHEVWYLNSSQSDDQIVDYYRKELIGAGYEVDKVSATSGGGQLLEFRKTGVNGYVATEGARDSMSRKYKDVLKIAYHVLPK